MTAAMAMVNEISGSNILAILRRFCDGGSRVTIL